MKYNQFYPHQLDYRAPTGRRLGRDLRAFLRGAAVAGIFWGLVFVVWARL